MDELLIQILDDPDYLKVVRCKDCARGELEMDGPAKGFINCPYQGYGELHSPEWYCADGIRKEKAEG